MQIKPAHIQRGIIDLSQGTPVDATPELIQSALRASSDSPRYPVTAGTKELQTAIRNWAISHLGATGDFDVLPVIGSKELVAWLPTVVGKQAGHLSRSGLSNIFSWCALGAISTNRCRS
jgi:aspartate/methionine/tyrosine aminotransferase